MTRLSHQQVIRARRQAEDNVIDYDALVDDRRRDVVSAVQAFQESVRDRRRAVQHLDDLNAVFTTEDEAAR